MLSQRPLVKRNLQAKLAADYTDLLKELTNNKLTLVGCYAIGKTIGEGTYGKVRLGIHQLTGQRVAIKTISKQHAPLMAREIYTHQRLEHPHIVTLYEVLMTETNIHIVSEYCSNGELFDMLIRWGRCSEYQAQRWFCQLAKAVHFIHSQQIVHRDLKLENILLDTEYNAKICDFGFARQTDRHQMLATFCGSLAYSAPEVIQHKKYTGPETDIWSLGVILYTLLAGELPFDDDSEMVIKHKIIHLEYQIPSYFSPEASDIIRQMLKYEPSERITMKDILQHPWLLKILDQVEEDPLSDTDSLFSDHRNRTFQSTLTDPSSCDDLFSKGKEGLSSSSVHFMEAYTKLSQMPMSHKMYSSSPMTRHSAPIAAHSLYDTHINRTSLPVKLPSHTQPAVVHEVAMTPSEQQLFTTLQSAGFDEFVLRRMRSKQWDAPSTLWQMLLAKLEERDQHQLPPSTKQKEILVCLPSPTPLQSCEVKNVKDAPMNYPKTQERVKKSPSSNSQHRSSWFSSVKAWLAPPSNDQQQQQQQQDGKSITTTSATVNTVSPTRTASPSPLPPTPHQDFSDLLITPPSPSWTKDLAFLPYRPRFQKYRRHTLQMSPPICDLDQFTYSATCGEVSTTLLPYTTCLPSIEDHRLSSVTRPPSAHMPSKTVTESISMVTVLPNVTMTGVPNTVTEIQLCPPRSSVDIEMRVKTAILSFTANPHSELKVSHFSSLSSSSSLSSESSESLSICTDTSQDQHQEEYYMSTVSSPASSIHQESEKSTPEKEVPDEARSLREILPHSTPFSYPMIPRLRFSYIANQKERRLGSRMVIEEEEEEG
ncbi:kinase-like domain-containing protein [Spinellus fusiger]|nr:kinase-like domain-containing protein [Spinellus fusiger]